MSQARVHRVDHARQLYAKVPKTDETGAQVVTPVKSKRSGVQKLSRKGRPVVRRIRISDKTRPLEMPKCSRCGVQINVGDPYRWFTVGFRSNYKRYRCMKSTCTPRPSELESSGPRSEIMSSVESAIDDLNRMDPGAVDTSDVESTVNSVGDAFRDAESTWREADESFGGGGNTENGERADTAGSAADDLESWSSSGDDEPDYEACEEDSHKPQNERADEEDDTPVVDRGDSECDSCTKIREDWGQELIDEAVSAIEEAEIP